MSTKIRPANQYGRELVRAARELGFTWRERVRRRLLALQAECRPARSV